MENKEYKNTEGYKKYVNECLSNMRQSRDDFNEESARKEVIKNVENGELKLVEIVKLFGYYSYFSRRFAAVTGKTFAGYLCAVRLGAAEHELIFTQKNVTAISSEVGFTDPSYFTRRFTEKNKMSPLAYRKKYASRMSVMKGE